MYTIHKLKPDRSITGLVPAIVSLIIMAVIGIFFGREAAFTFMAIFFWAFFPLYIYRICAYKQCPFHYSRTVSVLCRIGHL